MKDSETNTKNNKRNRRSKPKLSIWVQIKYRLIGIAIGVTLFLITVGILEVFNRLT